MLILYVLFAPYLSIRHRTNTSNQFISIMQNINFIHQKNCRFLCFCSFSYNIYIIELEYFYTVKGRSSYDKRIRLKNLITCAIISIFNFFSIQFLSKHYSRFNKLNNISAWHLYCVEQKVLLLTSTALAYSLADSIHFLNIAVMIDCI